MNTSVEVYETDSYDNASYSKVKKRSVDLIITSPPYNRGWIGSGYKRKTGSRYFYSTTSDNYSTQEYADRTISLFQAFAEVIKPKGTVLFNFLHNQRVSSRRDYQRSKFNAQDTLDMLCRISKETPFKLQEISYWDKRTSTPNHFSSIQLTHKVEPFYLFAKDPVYHTNKKVTTRNERGGTYYGSDVPFTNLVAGEPSVRNYPSFSDEVIKHLLLMYCPRKGTVLDPFVGEGGVLRAATSLKLRAIGFDMSKELVEKHKRSFATGSRKVL